MLKRSSLKKKETRKTLNLLWYNYETQIRRNRLLTRVCVGHVVGHITFQLTDKFYLLIAKYEF